MRFFSVVSSSGHDEDAVNKKDKESESASIVPISPYTAVACTAVEVLLNDKCLLTESDKVLHLNILQVYSFDAETLLSLDIAQNARIIKLLRESLKSNDPPQESIVTAYNSKFRKTLHKSRVMKTLF